MIGKDELERALSELTSDDKMRLTSGWVEEQGIDHEAFVHVLAEQSARWMKGGRDTTDRVVGALTWGFMIGFRVAEVAAAEEQVVLDRAIEASAEAAADEVRVVNRKFKQEQQLDEETVEEFAGSVYLRAINAARDEARRLGSGRG